jgi:MFS family permease
MKQDSDQQSSPAALPGNVKVLGVISLLNDMASEMIFPLLPTFLLTLLGGNRFYLGIIEGAADSVASLLKLWSGGRSDQNRRRKRFILFGYTLATIARPLIGLISAPWQLLLIRVGDRFGKGIRTAPRDALIADSTDKSIRGRAFGFHRSMDHLGAAIGPLIAAAFLFVWPDSTRTLFLWSLVPGILVVGLVLFGLREMPQAESTRKPLQLTLQPFGMNFRWFLLALLVFTLGNSSDAFLLVRAEELGVRKEFLPILWCVFHLTKSSSNWLLGFAVDRFGPRRFIFGGWLLYAVVYLVFGFASRAWHAWGLFLGYALFYGLTEPAEKTLAAQLVPADRKGLAFGWFNFTIGIGTLPASLAFGAIYQFAGPMAAFAWGAAIALVAMLLMAFVRPPDAEQQGEGAH